MSVLKLQRMFEGFFVLLFWTFIKWGCQSVALQTELCLRVTDIGLVTQASFLLFPVFSQSLFAVSLLP